MEYINEIAFHKGIRNEEPNKELAKQIISDTNNSAITEISKYLTDKNKSIASDCIAVLYHVGYEKPELISHLYDTFLGLLNNKNNRMVWGAMIAISTIASIEPDMVYKDKETIIKLIDKGTVITQVWGVYTLVNLCSVKSYRNELIPLLLEILKDTRAIDFAKRAETIKSIITESEKKEFVVILQSRINELSKSAQNKVNKLMK